MKYGFTIALMIGGSVTLMAQKGNVKGIIRDGAEVLPGVSVSLDGKEGTTTDIDGIFQLVGVDTGKHVLKITYIGYNALEYPVMVLQDQTVNTADIQLKENGHQIDEVKIVGNYRQGGKAKSINMTHISDKTLTVLSSELISKSPAKATALVIRQAPGVTVRDNKISLRGTPAEWTTSLLNGDWMPTADEKDASRVFNFEVFPSSLIDYIVINRTVTPDMEGDNIGGVIDFISKEPVAEKTFNLDISSGYDALSNKPLYSGSFLWGNVSHNNKFSYTVSGSYNGENYGKDAPSVAYGTNYNHSLARLQLDRVRGLRQTFGLTAAARYQFTDNFKLDAKILGGRMIEDEYRNRTSYNWSDGSGARIRLQNSRGIYDHELYGGALNASWNVSEKLKIEGHVASYYNRFQFGKTPQAANGAPNGNYTIEYVSPLLQYNDMIKTNFFGGPYDPNNSVDPNAYGYKMLDIDNPYGTGGDHYNNIQPVYQQIDGSGPLTASDYYLSSVFADMNVTKERDPVVGKMDITYTTSNQLKFKAGFKYRRKEGERNISFYEYRLNPVTSPKIYLSDQQTTAFDPGNNYLREWGSPYKGTFQPVLTKSEMNNFIGQHSADLVAFPMDINNNLFNQWLGSTYAYTENVAAGYLMSEWKPSYNLTLTGGLRVEHTSLQQSSDTIVTDENAPLGVNASPVHIDRTYTALLPSLNVLYQPDLKSNVRFAISRTFHRPNFEQTKPGYALYVRDQFLYVFGNPDLKPTYSLNFDLNYQHFWGTKGMFSAGVYYKHVTDHIFKTNQIDESQSVAGYTLKGYANARSSYVSGVEVLVDRKLDFLPGFWNGFGISANASWSYSRMQVPGRSKSQPLTDQTPLTANASISYEKGRVSTCVALNYTGAFSTELNLFSDPNTHEVVHDNTDYDIFMAAQYSLDYQFSFAVSHHFDCYILANNILNTPYRTYIGVPDRPQLTEYYRQRFYAGIKFHL
ncbi:TonB-dependent receptor [Taibaiella koreensis]|uniref:TonB-dependent receptor n=1 Tax=Taibaiella koreensis TaxID=1268548 RepID=UPI000E59BF70|nr:TonB-dependent receptor [Taibaiella koreensis]